MILTITASLILSYDAQFYPLITMGTVPSPQPWQCLSEIKLSFLFLPVKWKCFCMLYSQKTTRLVMLKMCPISELMKRKRKQICNIRGGRSPRQDGWQCPRRLWEELSLLHISCWSQKKNITINYMKFCLLRKCVQGSYSFKKYYYSCQEDKGGSCYSRLTVKASAKQTTSPRSTHLYPVSRVNDPGATQPSVSLVHTLVFQVLCIV